MFSRACWSMAAAMTAAAASIAFTSPAAAQQGAVVIYGQRPGGKLELVSYRDLNLVYPSHQSALYQRVGGAVRRVCSFDAGNIPIVDNDYRQCSGDAWGRARPQITRAVAFAHRRYR